MNWFRFYTNALDNPKVQRLSPLLFKVWVNLLCIARLNGGVIPPSETISFRLRMTDKALGDSIDKLIEKRLIDITSKGMQPHDWEGHQYESDSCTERVRRFRERQRNANETLQETHSNVSPSVSVSESISEVVFNKENLSLKCEVVRGDTFRPFWENWVSLTGRVQRESAACQAWFSVVTSENKMSAMACLGRYGASNEVRRGIVTNPDKWLYDQARDGFNGQWQPVPDSGTDKVHAKRNEVLKMAKLFGGMK